MNSEDDGEMNILSAVATVMRRNLIRNQGYYECSLPAYSIDEFKKNFKRRDSQYGPLQDNRRVHHITSKSSCHSHSCYFDPLFPLFWCYLSPLSHALFSSDHMTRYLGELFGYFLEHIFLCPFPAKRVLVICVCCYEKSYICIFPSVQNFQQPCITVVGYTCQGPSWNGRDGSWKQRVSKILANLYRHLGEQCDIIFTRDILVLKELQVSYKSHLPFIYEPQSWWGKLCKSKARKWHTEHSHIWAHASLTD